MSAWMFSSNQAGVDTSSHMRCLQLEKEIREAFEQRHVLNLFLRF